MSKHASPAVVGSFVLTALALLVVGIFVLSAGKLFRHTALLITYFDGSVSGLRVGAPVKFSGIEIGSVKDLRISMTGALKDPQHISIPVLLEIDKDRLSSQGIEPIELGPKQVQRHVALGLRAELATESLVTGVRYVELDIRPDTPAHLVGDRRYPEIPSVRSLTETLPEKVDHVVTKLAEVDFSAIAHSTQTTIDDVDALIRSPHLARAIARLDELTTQLTSTVHNLGPAISELTKTVASAHGTFDRVPSQVDTTLRDVQSAARSVRRLSDQLSRDPGAILRGDKQ
jgi:paraquat-inducible protein B